MSDEELTEQEMAEIDRIVDDQAQISDCLKALEQIEACCKTALKGDITDADLMDTLLDARLELLDHSPDREEGGKAKETYMEGLDRINVKIGDIACFYLWDSTVKDSDLQELLHYTIVTTVAAGRWFSQLAGKALGTDDPILALNFEKMLFDLIKEKSHE